MEEVGGRTIHLRPRIMFTTSQVTIGNKEGTRT